ncbi:MAG: hypothetical protein HY296_08310 [Thaumarchaeota archaeon]|nr:hypothetical protein [Nitrososphaerota archaeon]
MDSFNFDEYLLNDRVPGYKSVVVVGKPGTFGWSKRLRKAANCIIARWEGGDQISDRELGWHLGQFVRAEKITDAQRNEFYGAIRKLDKGKGGPEDLQDIKFLAKVLGLRVIMKSCEPPLSKVTPGPHGLTYRQAYSLAASIRKSTPGLEVRVVKMGDEGQESSVSGWWSSLPGSYTVRVGPEQKDAKNRN